MFKIKLTARARRELQQISRSEQVLLGQIINDLKENPTIGKPLTRELTRRFSYRVGMYRIIYRINKKDKIITILTAGHRSTIYN